MAYNIINKRSSYFKKGVTGMKKFLIYHEGIETRLSIYTQNDAFVLYEGNKPFQYTDGNGVAKIIATSDIVKLKRFLDYAFAGLMVYTEFESFNATEFPALQTCAFKLA
jgi:hypothetical protein